MKAVVLVGGFGTRLRPLTLTRPKQMLPVANRTMIDRVLEHLGDHGVTTAVLSLGYKPDAFLAAYPDGRRGGVELHYAVEPEPRDTAGAIRFVALDAGIDEPFVVVNGDVLTDLDIAALVADHAASGAEGTIALHDVEDPSAFGVVPTDATGRVTAFIEKPPRDEAPTNLINAGTYVLDPSVLARIAPDVPVNVERITFPAMVADGTLRAVDGDTYWIDAGIPSTYLQANLDLIDGRRGAPEPAVDATSEVQGSVERSVLGRAVVIEAGAEVRGSVLLPGAIVRAGAVVVDSVVGAGAIVGPGAKLSDGSVIGDAAEVPGGSTCVGVRIRGRSSGVRALVTGGAGFIGSTLVDRLLAEGHEVDVIDSLATGSLANLANARADRDNVLKVHQIDIRDAKVLELIERRRPEVVFHLAAQADVRVSVSDPAFDASVNVLGSVNVIEGARRAGARKVVFASSGGTIYGEPAPEDLPVKESHSQHPVSPYGVAKKVVSDYLHAYRELHQLEYTSLALANVYGPRQDPHGEAGVVAIFTAKLLAGDPCTVFGDGEQTRDFVYVDDVVDAFVRGADRGSGLICNIGTGVETSVNHLYATMAAAAGVTDPAVQAPARAGELARSALDPGRARIHLGWEPWTDLATGTTEVLRWFRERVPS